MQAFLFLWKFSGKTDPYVVLSLGDQVIRSKKNSQTTVIGPPGEPIWNQVFFALFVFKVHVFLWNYLFNVKACIYSGKILFPSDEISTIDSMSLLWYRIFICLLQTLKNKDYASK